MNSERIQPKAPWSATPSKPASSALLAAAMKLSRILSTSSVVNALTPGFLMVFVKMPKRLAAPAGSTARRAGGPR